MGREQVGFKAGTKEGLNRLLRECLGRVGHVSFDLVQFGLGIESDLDALV